MVFHSARQSASINMNITKAIFEEIGEKEITRACTNWVEIQQNNGVVTEREKNIRIWLALIMVWISYATGGEHARCAETNTTTTLMQSRWSIFWDLEIRVRCGSWPERIEQKEHALSNKCTERSRKKEKKKKKFGSQCGMDTTQKNLGVITPV